MCACVYVHVQKATLTNAFQQDMAHVQRMCIHMPAHTSAHMFFSAKCHACRKSLLQSVGRSRNSRAVLHVPRRRAADTHEAPTIACTCTRTHACVHTGTSAHMPTFRRQLAHGWSKSWHIASDQELHVSRQQRGWSEGRCGCSRMQQHARALWNRSLQRSDKGSAFFSGPTSGR